MTQHIEYWIRCEENREARIFGEAEHWLKKAHFHVKGETFICEKILDIIGARDVEKIMLSPRNLDHTILDKFKLSGLVAERIAGDGLDGEEFIVPQNNNTGLSLSQPCEP